MLIVRESCPIQWWASWKLHHCNSSPALWLFVRPTDATSQDHILQFMSSARIQGQVDVGTGVFYFIKWAPPSWLAISKPTQVVETIKTAPRGSAGWPPAAPPQHCWLNITQLVVLEELSNQARSSWTQTPLTDAKYLCEAKQSLHWERTIGTSQTENQSDFKILEKCWLFIFSPIPYSQDISQGEQSSLSGKWIFN